MDKTVSDKPQSAFDALCKASGTKSKKKVELKSEKEEKTKTKK